MARLLFSEYAGPMDGARNLTGIVTSPKTTRKTWRIPGMTRKGPRAQGRRVSQRASVDEMQSVGCGELDPPASLFRNPLP